jgi:hypothetical protein
MVNVQNALPTILIASTHMKRGLQNGKTGEIV